MSFAPLQYRGQHLRTVPLSIQKRLSYKNNLNEWSTVLNSQTDLLCSLRSFSCFLRSISFVLAACAARSIKSCKYYETCKATFVSFTWTHCNLSPNNCFSSSDVDFLHADTPSWINVLYRRVTVKEASSFPLGSRLLMSWVNFSHVRAFDEWSANQGLISIAQSRMTRSIYKRIKKKRDHYKINLAIDRCSFAFGLDDIAFLRHRAHRSLSLSRYIFWAWWPFLVGRGATGLVHGRKVVVTPWVTMIWGSA